ncbi:MAG: hypothetical protein JRI89_15690 [Deltaproteobacteria bacterium]|nr:hypothetical protein [Deltaproteobacteria bacterium]
MESAACQNQCIEERGRRFSGLFLLPGAALFVGYAAINHWLFTRGYAARTSLFLGEKCLLVFHGNPPRLENLGFVYPPLPYAFTLLCGNPFLGTALVGAAAASLFLGFLRKSAPFCQKGAAARMLSLLLFSYLCLSPMFLFLFTQRSNVCLFVLLFSLGVYALLRYAEQDLSIHLLLAGMVFGALFYVSFESFLLVGFFLLPLVQIVRCRNSSLTTVWLVLCFPMAFFALSWLYLNYVFMGDAFYFLHFQRATQGAAAGSQNLQAVVGNAAAALAVLGRELQRNFLLIMPYFMVLLASLFLRKRLFHYLHLILLAPLLTAYLRIYLGSFSGETIEYAIFLTTAVLIASKDVLLRERKWTVWLLTLCFCTSLAVSFILPLEHGSDEEKGFARALYGHGNFQNLQNDLELLERLGSKGRVLLDDTTLYSLVYLYGDPKRFLLPYEYEFETALSAPRLFVSYVVVSKNKFRDRLLGRYPLASAGFLQGYELVADFGRAVLYRRLEEKAPGGRGSLAAVK